MSTTADIQKYGRSRDGYIEYFIKVVHNGKVWGIKKRFSEFVQLNDYLSKSGYPVPSSLPKKTTVWKKVDDKLLQKRSKALQVYLNDLLKTFSVADNSLLKEFLEVEVNWLKSAKQQSFKKVQRMDLIPLAFSKLVIQFPVSRVKTSPFYRGGTSNGTGGGGNATIGSFSISHPTMNKTKSLSFSAMRSPSRKESFQQGEQWNPAMSIGLGVGGGSNTGYSSANTATTLSSTPQFSNIRDKEKDRKFSIDIFNLSSNNSNNHEAAYALQSAVKKSSYIKATDALWTYYRKDIEQLCEEADEDIEYDAAYFDIEDDGFGTSGPPSGPGMLLARSGMIQSSGNMNNNSKAKIMTMASLTRHSPVDYKKIEKVLSSYSDSNNNSSSMISENTFNMNGIACALIHIETKYIQAHMQWDPFHWNDDENPIVIQEFDQIPRLIAEQQELQKQTESILLNENRPEYDDDHQRIATTTS